MGRADSVGESSSSGAGSRERLDSESSTEGFEHLEPIGLEDLGRFTHSRASWGDYYMPCFDSISEDAPISDFPVTKLFSVAMAMKRKISGKDMGKRGEAATRARNHWKSALGLLHNREDPWANLHWESMPVENATRHRYNALTKTWKEDSVVVKMETHSFGQGAMRECYRLKKLSNFSNNQDWDRDCNNYVVKRYMDEAERTTYFEDVKLQQDAKLWGEEYNRHNPPKKVDIMMMAVLEFHERDGRPLYHIEHFIDGDYVKYNSNSGFVDNRVCRQTPHAFSHFTFERSGHELIVVDVQGVGDLYTDPQIHTAEGKEYGDGNLGTRGMALFFHSHNCTAICKILGLTQFDLTVNEKGELAESSTTSGSQTVLRGQELPCVGSPGDHEGGADFSQFFMRQRSNSASKHTKSVSGGLGAGLTIDVARANNVNSRRLRTYSSMDYSMEASPPASAPIYDCSGSADGDSVRSDCSFDSAPAPQQRRRRLISELSDESGYHSERMTFHELVTRKARPSNLEAEVARPTEAPDTSTLGKVHLDLAKYHETCRFVEDGNYDKDAAFFHLKAAADCGIVTAMITLAQIYLELPHDLLGELEAPAEDEDCRRKIGFGYMEHAAEAGDRGSMVFVARALDTGLNLDDAERRSAKAALEWYQKITDHDEEEGGDESDWGLDDPPYLLMARMAEILLDEDSKAAGVERDPNAAGELYNRAAESAMACMKGKLANQYYMLAEEAFGQCDEE